VVTRFGIKPDASSAAGSTVDVTVTASGSTSTLSKAFTYEPQTTNYPYPGGMVPTSLVYDPHRNYVYLLTNTQVDIFSLNRNCFLTPIVPPRPSWYFQHPLEHPNFPNKKPLRLQKGSGFTSPASKLQASVASTG
jgi:hypothetical protein